MQRLVLLRCQLRCYIKGSPVTISVTATRYTGTDHQYKTVTTNPTHSGGKGGSN